MNLKRFLSASIVVLLLACSDNSGSGSRTVQIGGLFSLSGGWSTLGQNGEAAMTIAIADVNDYLESTGSDIRLAMTVADTRLEPPLAVNELKNLYATKGIRFTIGPQSSAEITAIKEELAAKEIVMVSPGSTASSLSISGDGIFRYCPGDAIEGLALSRTMYNSGKRAMITLSRDDVGNRGLQTSVNTHFAELGGLVDAIDPYSVSLNDYSVLLGRVKTSVETQVRKFGTGGVGVFIASFEELSVIFAQAANDPVLSSVNWYGADGVVQTAPILSDPAAAGFAITTGFFAPIFGLPSDTPDELERVAAYIKNETGLDPDAYALSVYDAVWVIARTLTLHQGVLKDYSALIDAFQFESNKYSGITGALLLDENGDRKSGAFDYWGIVETNNGYAWSLVGKSN